MAVQAFNGPSVAGNAFAEIMGADDIGLGSDASYRLCTLIYVYHPLGPAIAERPIDLALSQNRKITVQGPLADIAQEKFEEQWEIDGANDAVHRSVLLSRIYGVGSLGMLEEGKQPSDEVDYEGLYKSDIFFNAWDALNTAGSLVLNLDPNAPNFLKPNRVAVAGKEYHRNRVIVRFNERPIYLAWTDSAYGYVGRSVYQRPLYPLKSFLQTMRADDMVARKAGLLVAKIESAGSIINRAMEYFAGIKRSLLKIAETDNVLTIGLEESVETLNMQNVNEALSVSRRNILENIAASNRQPAQLLNSQTFAEGFGEGSEDAKMVARYIDTFRIEMQPIMAWMDRIIQYRAWNPEWWATIRTRFPETYGKIDYAQGIALMRKAYRAVWPSLLTEEPSKQVEVDEVKLKAIVSLVEVLLPALDPMNRAVTIDWAAANFNELHLLFQAPLQLDIDDLRNYQAPTAGEPQLEEPHDPKPFAAQDSAIWHPARRLARDMALSAETVSEARAALTKLAATFQRAA